MWVCHLEQLLPAILGDNPDATEALWTVLGITCENMGIIMLIWHTSIMFLIIQFNGVSRTVPDECSPYSIDEDPMKEGCKLPRLSHYPIMSGPLEEKFEIFRTCQAIQKRQSFFKMQPPYKVGRKNNHQHPRRTEFDIMFEIQTHGPVQATMEIFRDVFYYKDGIYSKSQFAGDKPLGFHSVKIVGWGEQNGRPFWVIFNDFYLTSRSFLTLFNAEGCKLMGPRMGPKWLFQNQAWQR